MKAKLIKIRENAEYVLESSPNFHIQHKMNATIKTVDELLATIPEEIATLTAQLAEAKSVLIDVLDTVGRCCNCINRCRDDELKQRIEAINQRGDV